MVVKQGGARCTCGRRGCMEAYAGRRAMEAKAKRLVEKGHHTDLFKIMRERGRETLSSGVWAHALAHEDKLAKRLIERAVQALGSGVASAVNLLDVELVLLGGGLGSRFGEPMLERIIGGDEAAPLQRQPSAGDADGRARRPRRGAWRGAALGRARRGLSGPAYCSARLRPSQRRSRFRLATARGPSPPPAPATASR